MTAGLGSECGYCGGLAFCVERDVLVCPHCGSASARAFAEAVLEAPPDRSCTIIGPQGHAPGCLAVAHDIVNERASADGRYVLCASCGRIQPGAVPAKPEQPAPAPPVRPVRGPPPAKAREGGIGGVQI